MIKYGKKLRKRITAFLMTLVMVMTIGMSVSPMEVKAATTYSESVNASAIRLDDILTASAVIVKDSVIYDSIRISVDNDKYGTNIYTTLNVSSILNRLGKSDLYTIRCTGFTSNSLNFVTVKPPEATVSVAPTAASLTYNGNNQKLLKTGGTATNGTMCYCITNTASAPAYDEFTITDINSVTKINAGTYYVWYMAKGNSGYENSSKAYTPVEIAKAIPTLTTPTVSNSVSYGIALSDISLDTDWRWENGNTVPEVGNTGYSVVYNKTLDTENYDWSSVPGYNNGKITRTVVVPVNPVEKTDATFTVPTILSKTYDATKTLSELLPFTDSNWEWIESDGQKIPKISDTKFTAKYTVPSPDDKNYTWDKLTGYKIENGKIVIERELPVTISPAAQTASVQMKDYDFDGVISAPTITGAKESPVVKYYYYKEGNNQDVKEWKNMTSTTLDKGTYYIYAQLEATANYAEYTTPAVRFVVNPKTMTDVIAYSVDVEYDGNEHSITVSGYPEGATVYYGTSIDNCNSTNTLKYKDAQTDAHTVYYRISAKGYNDYTGSATVKINPKVAELRWDNTSLIYNGCVQTPSATVINLCENDICTVTVEGGKKNYSESAYIATATALSNANYIIKPVDSTKEFTISPKGITADMINLDQVDKNYTVTGGTITPIVIVKDGTAVLEMGGTKDYVLSGDTSHTQYGTHTITVTGKGNYSSSVDVQWNITDPNAPSGKIVIVSKSWDSFPADTLFKYFFKEMQQVTIQAMDGSQESGVDKVYYCKSLIPFTTEGQLSGVTWTEIANGGSFDIIPNANVYVYAKITDKAGNVTYLASDGIVVYTDSAQDTESITFTKTSTADVTANVALNGNTISTITLGNTTLEKDRDYTLSDNGASIAFKASFLQTLAASETAYTLRVSYNPGGKIFVDTVGNVRPLDTTIALTVKKAQGSITDISDVSKIYNGYAVEEPNFITTNDKGTNNANVTFAYKKKGTADNTYTTEKPFEAGTYVVKITVDADDNYETVSNTAEFMISKAEISSSVDGYDGVYDGASHTISVNVTGMTDAYTVSYGVMPKETDAQIVYGQTPLAYRDAGTYTVYYKISSVNYYDKYGSAKVKISPKTIGISWKNLSFVYDGEEHTPIATATGLEGDDVCMITVTGAKVHAGTDYVATATAVSNPNYKLPDEVKTEFVITPAKLTVVAVDTSKHIGKNDPEFTYKLTAGALVEGDSLNGISVSRKPGETAGEYVLTVTDQIGSNPDYLIAFLSGTFRIEDHVAAIDVAVTPTCTETGVTEGSHCSICEKVLVAQNQVPALGHDWSGDWTITREATATDDGRREVACKRDKCGHIRYESIPAIGTEETVDPNAGNIEKYVDVVADSPILEATIKNKKSELLEAPSIFTLEEKEAIRSGADAKVWLEVAITDEKSIPEDEKAKMTEAAKQIAGDNPDLKYFDASLYSQVGDRERMEICEPGSRILITIRLSEELLNHDNSISREYKILRLHNGDVTVLEAILHEETDELSFETDKFSTYAIVYSDTVIVPEVDVTPSDPENTIIKSPETGDTTELINYVILMHISLVMMLGLCYKKKKLEI